MLVSTASFHIITAVKDCASVALEGAGSSYKLDASLGSWPGFCRGFPKEEIIAGGPYTVSVELFNKDSSHGANVGHPGVAFNVIDVNNYDLVYFRLDSDAFKVIIQKVILTIEYIFPRSCRGSEIPHQR